MTITVNGESREVPEGLTVTGLLKELGFPGDRVAVERNLDILPREKWAATPIAPGDRFEIVHFVGGGLDAG
jgi:thiamine biosynthesis protein ThiS